MEPGPFTSEWLHCPLSFQTSNLGILPPHHCQTLTIDPCMSLILSLSLRSCEHCLVLVLSVFFPAWLWVLYFRVSVEAVTKVSVKAGVTSESSPGNSKDTCLLMGFIFLGLVELRASVLCCLLAGGCPVFLVTWASLRWSLASLKCAHQGDKGKVTILWNAMMEVTSHQFCHILLFRSSLRLAYN